MTKVTCGDGRLYFGLQFQRVKSALWQGGSRLGGRDRKLRAHTLKCKREPEHEEELS